MYTDYFLERKNKAPIDWIIDPYAREFGIGKLSAFTLGYEPHVWSDEEELMEDSGARGACHL